MKSIRQKILKIMEHDLDSIIMRQKNKSNHMLKQNPIFDNFDGNLANKLKKHDKFIKSIEGSIKNTKQ